MSKADPLLGRVVVLGLGVMGGSVARALSARGAARRVTGWSPDADERASALAAKAVDDAPDAWRDAVAAADLVVVAVPLAATLSLFSEIAAVLPDSTTLTDVASLKEPTLEAARNEGFASRWVGSHPMAGSASSGFEASRADLYDGAVVWTVDGDAGDEHRTRVDTLWRLVGASPASIDAVGHDRLMGAVSHLPQLTATALGDVLRARGVTVEQLGPGGCDMTRLAASSPEMWTDLLVHGGPSLTDGLRDVAAAAVHLADLVEAGDMDGLGAVMRRTRAWRSPT